MKVKLLETPKKPIADRNQYRAIELENGMEAMLISVGDESRKC